jgi:hypothetical protein
MPIAHPRGKLLVAMLMLTAASLGAPRVWGASPDAQQDDAQSDSSSADLLANCPPPDNPAATPPRCPWYIQTTGVLLQRDAGHTTDFAELNVGGFTNNVVLSTRYLDFPLKAGGQVLIGHTLNTWNQFEFSYIATEQWSDSAFVRNETPGYAGIPGSLSSSLSHFDSTPGLDFNNLISIEHESTFQTAELNWRRYLDMPPGRMTVSTLLGVRYMEIRENFGYQSTSAVPRPLGSQTSLNTDTKNNLLGVQLGTTLECYVQGPWWVNFEIKGAACQNDASETTVFDHVDQNGAPTEYANHREHRATSWIGDLALTCVYRFSPRATARFGYQAIFVDGVALADVNALQDINFSATPPLGPGNLHQNSNVVYHGPFAGLELAW